MKRRLSGFLGENRAVHPRMLLEGVGVTSTNQRPGKGFRPWKAPSTVATVGASRLTIYRFGQDTASDANYWFSWTTVVHAIRGFIADDTTERTFFTGSGAPKWTDNTIALASTPYPTATRQLGVPAPASAPTVADLVVGSSTNSEVRYYCYTYVTDKGEESAPSPVSAAYACLDDTTATVSGLVAAPGGSFTVDRKRLYVTVTGQAGDTEFLFLREIASGLTSTTDDLRDRGEVLPSDGWLTPPGVAQGGALNLTEPVLSCLTAMWNGMAAGITGNAVRFCVPYRLFAWPLANEYMPPDAKPIALGTFGQNLLVLTNGAPCVVSGSAPDSMDGRPLEFNEACVSVRSVVSFGHGVAWACPDGLAYYGAGGPKMLTAGILEKEDWEALVPSTVVGCVIEGLYIGFYTVASVTRGFVIDPLNPTGMYFLDTGYAASFFDPIQDRLYVLSGTSVQKWDAGSAMTAVFKSKTFREAAPVSFAYAEVIADSYPVTLKVNSLGYSSAQVTALVAANARFTSITGGIQYSVSVTSRDAVPLPEFPLNDDWQIELSTAIAVQGVVLAESTEELDEVPG